MNQLQIRTLGLRAAIALVKAGYKDSQPRDAEGKWTTGPSGETRWDRANREIAESRTKSNAFIRKTADTVAKKLNFDSNKIQIHDRIEDSNVLGGGGFKLGSYSPKQDTINLFSYALDTVDDSRIAGIIAHEIMHGKFEPVMDQYSQERAAAEVLDGAKGDVFKADGSLRDQYRKNFPYFAALYSLYEAKPTQLERGGVSKYARSYWDDLKNYGQTSYHLAVNETLAEMAAYEAKTGHLPWRGGGWAVDRWHQLYYTIHALHTKLEAEAK